MENEGHGDQGPELNGFSDADVSAEGFSNSNAASEEGFSDADDEPEDEFLIEPPEITMANAFPLSQDMETGRYRQCAVCEYELRHCDEQCAFRMSLPGTRQGREDYAKCVLVYGDTYLHYIVRRASVINDSPTLSRYAIEFVISNARQRFELSSANEYNWILVNSYLPFSWNIRRLVRSESQRDVNIQAHQRDIDDYIWILRISNIPKSLSRTCIKKLMMIKMQNHRQLF